jgi:hypothetical protein
VRARSTQEVRCGACSAPPHPTGHSCVTSLPTSVPWLQVTLIDFPQMVSVGHANARELFQRDVECIMRFFKRKVRQQTPELLR